MVWFWLWLLFVLVVILIPVGYGWGYRKWGMPYPSYYRRRGPRRADLDVVGGGGAVREADSGWGLFADIVWLAAIVAVLWLIVALLV